MVYLESDAAMKQVQPDESCCREEGTYHETRTASVSTSRYQPACTEGSSPQGAAATHQCLCHGLKAARDSIAGKTCTTPIQTLITCLTSAMALQLPGILLQVKAKAYTQREISRR